MRMSQPYLMHQMQQRTFTRAFKKIILTQDVTKLGFKGEICFVKPGRAFNDLVPKKKALYFTDPDVPDFIKSIEVSISSSINFHRMINLSKSKLREDLRFSFQNCSKLRLFLIERFLKLTKMLPKFLCRALRFSSNLTKDITWASIMKTLRWNHKLIQLENIL